MKGWQQEHKAHSKTVFSTHLFTESTLLHSINLSWPTGQDKHGCLYVLRSYITYYSGHATPSEEGNHIVKILTI